MNSLIKDFIAESWRSPTTGSCLERAIIELDGNVIRISVKDKFYHESLRRGRFKLIKYAKKIFGDKIIVFLEPLK